MSGQRCTLMALLFMFTVSESSSYISKIVCYQQFQRYLQPAFERYPDTGGFPEFRRSLDACSFDQDYQMFDSLKAVLIDSLARTWKMEYLMAAIIDPVFEKFWLPFYLYNEAFFKYALLQCEKRAIAPDSIKFEAYYSTQYFTAQNIKDQRWFLKTHPDSNICLRNNCGFVDSIGTLILADNGLPKYYRQRFVGMDRYIDPINMKGNGFSLKIDSTFKGRRLYGIYTIDSSFIAIAGDTGLIAISADAGRHWRKITPFTANDINAIGFLTKAKGFCIENNMDIWSTKDSGATWQKTNISPGMPQKMIVFDSTRLLILDDFNGNIWSGDGGKTWTKTSVFRNNSTSVINRNCAYGVGDSKVRKTTDGGATWQDICLLDIYPRIVTFLDENSGLIGWNLGEMAITTDGGIHWRQFSLPTLENIIGILRLRDHSIIAITDGFSVFSTTDRGDTWIIEKVYHPSTLQAGVQMMNRRSVWVGSNGFLFFCDSLAVSTSAPGQKNLKPIVAMHPHFLAETSYNLDGRRITARNKAPGVRLRHGLTKNMKTVFMK
jgi:photosystem II stability/assembly factor-like uncharacterized protein